MLWTRGLVGNLAGVWGSRHLGNSKRVYSGRGHRGIFHLSAHAIDAAFVGPPRVPEQRESVQLPRDAGRVCAAVIAAASCARKSLQFELVFSGSDGPSGRALFAVRYLYGMSMFLFLAG